MKYIHLILRFIVVLTWVCFSAFICYTLIVEGKNVTDLLGLLRVCLQSCGGFAGLALFPYAISKISLGNGKKNTD